MQLLHHLAKQHCLNPSACCLQNCLSPICLLQRCCCNLAAGTRRASGCSYSHSMSFSRKCRCMTVAMQHCLGDLACACSAIAVALQPGQALPVAALTPLGKCNTTNSAACNHQLYSMVWGFALTSCSIAGAAALFHLILQSVQQSTFI